MAASGDTGCWCSGEWWSSASSIRDSGELNGVLGGGSGLEGWDRIVGGGMSNAGEIVDGVLGIVDAVGIMSSAPEGNAGHAGLFEKVDEEKGCMPCISQSDIALRGVVSAGGKNSPLW